MTFSYTNNKGKKYFLHGRDSELKNGHKRTIYFFAKDERDGALEEVPDGWEVMETKNGLPVLRKIK